MGFLTAIVAFGIIRLEQWLFDIKGGYCKDGWYKAERFCCPVLGTDTVPNHSNASIFSIYPFNVSPLRPDHGGGPAPILSCADWVTWAEAFDNRHSWLDWEEWVVEFVMYTIFAVSSLSFCWLIVQFILTIWDVLNAAKHKFSFS